MAAAGKTMNGLDTYARYLLDCAYGLEEGGDTLRFVGLAAQYRQRAQIAKAIVREEEEDREAGRLAA